MTLLVRDHCTCCNLQVDKLLGKHLKKRKRCVRCEINERTDYGFGDAGNAPTTQIRWIGEIVALARVIGPVLFRISNKISFGVVWGQSFVSERSMQTRK